MLTSNIKKNNETFAFNPKKEKPRHKCWIKWQDKILESLLPKNIWRAQIWNKYRTFDSGFHLFRVTISNYHVWSEFRHDYAGIGGCMHGFRSEHGRHYTWQEGCVNRQCLRTPSSHRFIWCDAFGRNRNRRISTTPMFLRDRTGVENNPILAYVFVSNTNVELQGEEWAGWAGYRYLAGDYCDHFPPNSGLVTAPSLCFTVPSAVCAPGLLGRCTPGPKTQSKITISLLSYVCAEEEERRIP